MSSKSIIQSPEYGLVKWGASDSESTVPIEATVITWVLVLANPAPPQIMRSSYTDLSTLPPNSSAEIYAVDTLL
mgnify:CR=1 FL=1